MSGVAAITDPDRIRNYLRDESWSFEGCADVVYLPANEDELAQVLAELNDRRMPVTLSAGGTSITGTRVPMYGGAVVSMERMTRVEDRPRRGFPAAWRPGLGVERVERGQLSILVDRAGRRAVLPPAIPLAELDLMLEPMGLLYPPDPTEMNAQIAGTVSTNAAGARSFHYGPTRSWVRRLRVVLADGDRADLLRAAPVEKGVRPPDVNSPLKKGSSLWHTRPRVCKEPQPRAAGPHLQPVMGSDLLFDSSAADGATKGRPGKVFTDRTGRDTKLIVPAEGGARAVPIPSPDIYPLPDCKNAAGLYLRRGMDPIDLFIGAEGILGAVSEVEVDLIERPPETLTVIAFFPQVEDALGFVDFAAAERETFGSLSLEFIDGRGLDLMRRRYTDLPADCAGAVLFERPYAVEAEAGPYPTSHLVGHLREVLARFRSKTEWVADTEHRELLRLFRHALPELVNEFARAHQGKLGTDMAVPRARFREMYAAYERTAGDTGVRFAMWGHIGDSHLHLNFLAETADEMRRAKSAYVELARRAVQLGGTISAEHGVGKKRFEVEPGRVVPYLGMMYGEQALAAVAAVKRALDPNWILNVGNMIPPEAAAWT